MIWLQILYPELAPFVRSELEVLLESGSQALIVQFLAVLELTFGETSFQLFPLQTRCTLKS